LRARRRLLFRLKAIRTIAAPFLTTLSAAKEEIARECTILVEISRARDDLLDPNLRSGPVLFHEESHLLLASTDAVSESRRRWREVEASLARAANVSYT
jgi:hypothetical protein